MEVPSRLLVSVAVLITCVVTSWGMAPCPAPLEACKCQHQQTMECHSTGMTQLPNPDHIPKSYTALEFFNNTFNDLSSVNYPWVTHLMIVGCKVNTIVPGAFKNMTNLRELDLSSNHLTSVTKPMFEGLSDLNNLNLGSNRLKSLTMHALCPSFLKNLTHLELEYNMIKTLPDKMMISSKLSYLNLGNNMFEVMPHHIWKTVKGLKELHMHGNPLKQIRDESFDYLTEMEILNVDQCSIVDISNNALQGMHKLKELYLGNNKLTVFEAAVVKPCAKSLVKLHLQNNKLTTLDQAVGAKLTNCRDLNITDNPLTCDCKIHWIHRFKKGKQPICYLPEKFKGQPVGNVTSTMNCPNCTGSHCTDPNRGVIALAVGIPILIICAGLIAFFLWRIAKSRKADQRKSVRYSAVYRDTVEANKNKGALA